MKERDFQMAVLEYDDTVLVRDDMGQWRVFTDMVPRWSDDKVYTFPVTEPHLVEDRYVEDNSETAQHYKKDVNLYYAWRTCTLQKIHLPHLVLDAKSGNSAQALIHEGASPETILVPNNTSSALEMPRGPIVVAESVQDLFQIPSPVRDVLLPRTFGSVFLDLMCCHITIINHFESTLRSILERMDNHSLLGLTYTQRSGTAKITNESFVRITASPDPFVQKNLNPCETLQLFLNHLAGLYDIILVLDNFYKYNNMYTKFYRVVKMNTPLKK